MTRHPTGLSNVIELIQRSEILVCLCLTAVLVGCAKQASQVDDAPFREAIERYLQESNMALAIKEIKSGPTIDGSNAALSASLTHDQLGGPSVTWDFQFARQPDGNWSVTGHQD